MRALILHVLAPLLRGLCDAMTDVGHARARASSKQMDDDAEKLPAEGGDPEDEDARTLQQMQHFVSLRTDLQSLASHLSLAPNLIQCARALSSAGHAGPDRYPGRVLCVKIPFSHLARPLLC